ncbi:MAG: flavin reductase [Bacteroidota bacterium]
MHLQAADFSSMDAFFRRHFFNTLPGPRSVHLLGTKGHRGTENLGVFSSVVHLGASPPHLGFVLRPLTVPRHSYHHLLAQGYFTLNTIHSDILPAAHQSSANYAYETSEFAAVGLTPEYSAAVPAPYVKESRIKLGLRFVEEHYIKANNTRFIVGEVVELFVPDQFVSDEGYVDHNQLGTLAVTGLEQYHQVEQVAHYPYARVKQ